MAGHSHAANIAHRKGIVDAKRGKLFSKLCRAIYVAAKNGGGDPEANLKLRYAIDKARFVVDAKHVAEDRLMEVALEAGADDLQAVDGYFEVTCDPRTFESVRKALEAHKIAVESAET